MEDLAIVQLYWDRDEEAIVQSDRKYGAFCNQIAWNLLSLREDAEECVNDTWHAAWNAMPPQRPDSLKAFFGRITRNFAISRFRASRAQKRYNGINVLLSELEDCVPAADTVENQMDRRELAAAISGWLDSLDRDDRVLFVRRYWHGEAVKELADQVGCTPNKLAQRMMKLRQGLRSRLEQEHYI